MSEKETKSFFDKVVELQQEYTSGKTEDNDFGGYKYRNIEKMLATLKPLLKKKGLFVGFSDELIFMGDRYYIQSTATITDGDRKIEATALAREEYEKKKSDASQLTGSASTYARKYALCGLLGVDDGVNDPDSKDNDREHYTAPAQTNKKATDKQIEWMLSVAEKKCGDKDVHVWLTNLLTMKPEDVPVFKVKDAVDLINKQPYPKSKELKADDVVVTDEDIEALDRGEIPY